MPASIANHSVTLLLLLSKSLVHRYLRDRWGNGDVCHERGEVNFATALAKKAKGAHVQISLKQDIMIHKERDSSPIPSQAKKLMKRRYVCPVVVLFHLENQW